MPNARRLIVIGAMIALPVAGAALLAQAKATPPPAAQTAKPTAPAVAGRVSSPKDVWGHNVGDDYFLANYKQEYDYFNLLAKQSNRIHIKDIGKSSEGRPMITAIVTAPANYPKLARYQEISRRLSLNEVKDDAEARALAKEGKAVIWIDGGLHATEVLGAQQLIEMVYQMVSLTDEETMRFLNDTIILFTPVNPDGQDLVSDWYMKQGNMNVPVLYNKYAGHDDNRDSYMNALAETTNISRVMYREWYPQIMYNHHQTGPAGTVMFAPPFRDPLNFNFHPGIAARMDLIGSVLADRFIAEHKPGVTTRKGSNYSTWWNGGLRTTAYFHNELGILTETIGNPTPIQGGIPFMDSKLIPDMNMWWPIGPKNEWHFRQSIDYSITANRAILDFASRYREVNLYNIYQMGKDMIQWGSEDHWTITPHEITRAETELGLPLLGSAGGGRGGGGGGGRGGGGALPEDNPLWKKLHDPAARDPRGFILPSNQPDFGTATKFVNALLKSGITIMRATAPFTVAGKQYPKDSYVVKSAQPFRAHVMDMFEPQDHPDDFAFPGAPPTHPYDNAGYTLAFQMGVQFDRILDGFDGPFEKITTELAKVPAGIIKTAQAPAGYYFTHQANDSVTAVVRLLKAGDDVMWLDKGPMGNGTFYVAARPTTLAVLQKAATDLGISFESAATAPTGAMKHLKPLRVALFDTYGGGMPSGWNRLIFENFEIPYDVVYPPDLDKGNLKAKYDVIVFNGSGVAGGGGRGGGGGGAPAPDAGAPGAAAAPAGRGAGNAGGRGQGGGGREGFTPQPIPEEFARRQGQLSAATMDKIKEFVNQGGTAIYIGNVAMQAATLYGLPVTNQLAGIGQDKFYVPGSVLRVSVDDADPIAHGLAKEMDVFYDNNPVFKLNTDAASKGVKPVAWFNSPSPLRSGWAWGADVLDKGVEIVDATVGQGKVYLFAPEITFRSQPHGTFKFLFNALLLAGAK
jgi:hypothetical protein